MIVWCTLMQCACEQNVDGMGKIIHYSREDFCVINMVVMYGGFITQEGYSCYK